MVSVIYRIWRNLSKSCDIDPSNFGSFAKQTTMFGKSAAKTSTTNRTKNLSKQSTPSYISIVPIVEFLFFIGKFGLSQPFFPHQHLKFLVSNLFVLYLKIIFWRKNLETFKYIYWILIVLISVFYTTVQDSFCWDTIEKERINKQFNTVYFFYV